MFDNLKFWKKKDEISQDSFSQPSTDSQSDPFSFDSSQTQNPDPFASNTHSEPDFQMPSLDSMQSQFSQSTQNPQNTQPTQAVHQQQYQQVPGQTSSSEMSVRDVELILSRLDLIKSELQNLNHRISLIEQQQRVSHDPQQNKYW